MDDSDDEFVPDDDVPMRQAKPRPALEESQRRQKKGKKNLEAALSRITKIGGSARRPSRLRNRRRRRAPPKQNRREPPRPSRRSTPTASRPKTPINASSKNVHISRATTV